MSKILDQINHRAKECENLVNSCGFIPQKKCHQKSPTKNDGSVRVHTRSSSKMNFSFQLDLLATQRYPFCYQITHCIEGKLYIPRRPLWMRRVVSIQSESVDSSMRSIYKNWRLRKLDVQRRLLTLLSYLHRCRSRQVLLKVLNSEASGLNNFFIENYWRISECSDLLSIPESPFKIKEFNHLTRECLDLDVSIKFYKKLFGFTEVPRPPFESTGCWLWGHGLNLHLIQTEKIKERQVSDILRLMHYKGMPIADHFAFLVDDIKAIENFLDAHGVFYYQDDNVHTGTYQIFLFDPDFNVVEISNCAPPIGEIQCTLRTASDEPACAKRCP